MERPVMAGDLAERPVPRIVALSTKNHSRDAKWGSLTRQIAESNFEFINHMYSGGKDAFPQNFRMWYVDKFYPESKWGPLYVDEPRFHFDEARCEAKRSFFEKKGLKYLVLKTTTTIEEAMSELEGQA